MNLIFKNIQKISPNIIDKLETDLNLKLPIDYKEFLLKNNGGVTEVPHCFDRKHNDGLQEMVIENFLSVNEIYSSHDNLKDWNLYRGLLAIAQSIGAPTICIGTEDKNFGKIFILDGDFGTTFQNNSFGEFLNELRECK